MVQKGRQKVVELFLDTKRTPKGCLKRRQKVMELFWTPKGRQKVVALALTSSNAIHNTIMHDF